MNFFTKKAFTLVELMIVIAIIGILATALFPSMTSYLARARDTTRFNGAKNIKLTATLYQQDMGFYPNIGPIGNDSGGNFTTYISNCIGYPSNQWDALMKPLLIKYTGKNVLDPVGQWPLCHWYILPKTLHCPNDPVDAAYSIVFANEASRAPDIGTLYSFQTQNGTYGRWCLTGN